MNIKIFAKTIEEEAKEQISLLMKQKAFKNEKVRIMSDVHVGKGCVIGFTSTISDKIIPNVVGVDLYCGMLVIKLGNIDFSLEELDKVIRNEIPSGFKVHENISYDKELLDLFEEIKKMKCFKYISYNNQIKNGIGTLGSGNHFIEIDIDKHNNKYLVIHSGSRNLGNQVANVYQDMAINYCKGNKLLDSERNDIIKKLKEEHREKEISTYLNNKHKEVDIKLDNDLCYLEGSLMDDYLNDIKVCYKYAHLNRQRMALTILNSIFDNVIIEDDNYIVNNIRLESFETLHNYIDLDNGFIRKGAVSAQKNEKLIIPINMKDGSLICIGRGNEDWNYSAPHGAGRLMSRKEAKKKISMSEYKNSMKGIYSTSVNENTIDESPQAYKSIDEIKELIVDTVDIIDIIKPIYNYKA